MINPQPLARRQTGPTIGQLLLAIVISSSLQLTVVLIPFLVQIVEVTSHPGSYWSLVLGCALAPVTVIEIGKLLIASRIRQISRAREPSRQLPR